MAIFGAQVVTSPTNPTNTDGGRVYGKNSEVFTANDLVTDGAGVLEVAAASEAIYGIVLKTQTMAADNQTVAKIKPLCFPIDQQYEFLMGTNADLNPAASVGVYYNITGATGAQVVDVTGGATTGLGRVVICTAVDPNGVGGSGAGSGLRQGLFKIVKPTDIRQIGLSS
jgi:hypothetical protein